MSGRAPERGGKRGGGGGGGGGAGGSSRRGTSAAPAAESPLSTMGSMRDVLPSQGEAAAAAGVPTGRPGEVVRELNESDLVNPQSDEARRQAVLKLQSLTLASESNA